MKTVFLNGKDGVWQALEVIKRGGIAFFLGRMGMMLCSATQAEAISSMILLRLAKRHGNKNFLGKYYPKFTQNMDRDGEAESFKGLHKKLSHLLLKQDLVDWARDEYVSKFAAGMPRDTPVILRFPLNEENLPLSLRKNPTFEIIFTDMVQGMVVDNGPLYALLKAAREEGVHIVGTSANFAGEPTIITTRELHDFINSLTGVKKVYLDYGNQKNRRGLDSLSILQPTGVDEALVLRKARDYGTTRDAFARKQIRLTDAPKCVDTTIAERIKNSKEGY